MNDRRTISVLAIVLALPLVYCSGGIPSDQRTSENKGSQAAAPSQGGAAQQEATAGQVPALTGLTVPQTEDAIVEQIKKEGVGKRFVIETSRPVGKGSPSRLTLSEKPDAPDSFSMDTTENAGDTFPYFMGQGAYIAGFSSIHRFAGTVKYEGCTFYGEGDKQNRLTFLLSDQGHVYMRGKGRVVLPDGKEVKLGY